MSDEIRIERRIEARHAEPDYEAWVFDEADVRAGRHRTAGGG